MSFKRLFLFIGVPVVAFAVAFTLYLTRDHPPGDTTPRMEGAEVRSTEDIPRQETLREGSGTVAEGSPEIMASTRPTRTVSRAPSTGKMTDAPESVLSAPAESQGLEPPAKPSIPSPRPVVSPREEKPMVKLCGGEPISQCEGVDLAQSDAALLLLEILGLGRGENAERAFEILETLRIVPAAGWDRRNPKRPITPPEMEEVRCCVSLAFEDGLVQVGSSAVAAAFNRFCEDLKAATVATEDSGIVENHLGGKTETGYQGGTGDVVSSAF
jgi:hypothetical protein